MASAKRGNTGLVIIGAIILVGLILMFLLAKPRYNWYEHYTEDRDLPYGTSLLQELLERSSSDVDFITVNDTLHKMFDTAEFKKNSNYVYIGRELYLDSLDLVALDEFIRAGNHALVISHTFSSLFLEYFIDHIEYDYELMFSDQPLDRLPKQRMDRIYDSTVVMTLEDFPETAFNVKYIFNQLPSEKSWMHFFYAYNTEQDQPEHLGYYNDEYPCFIRYELGKGSIMMHSAPLAFSNYWLGKEEGFAYANSALSYLGDGDVIWDKYSREYRFFRGDYSRQRYIDHDDGPLAYILSQRSLKWAWFVLLIAGFSYLIFGAKRRQQPVPVVEPPRNTSVDFAETIGHIFRLENEHRKLTKLKMRLFNAHIRERYNLRKSQLEKNREQFIANLSERSGVKEEDIRAIFDIYDIIEGRNDPDGDKLIRLHNAIEKFHAHAR